LEILACGYVLITKVDCLTLKRKSRLRSKKQKSVTAFCLFRAVYHKTSLKQDFNQASFYRQNRRAMFSQVFSIDFIVEACVSECFLWTHFCICFCFVNVKEYWISSLHRRTRYYMLAFFVRVAVFYFEVLHAKFVLRLLSLEVYRKIVYEIHSWYIFERQQIC
jgi:hypothetical protein